MTPSHELERVPPPEKIYVLGRWLKRTRGSVFARWRGGPVTVTRYPEYVRIEYTHQHRRCDPLHDRNSRYVAVAANGYSLFDAEVRIAMLLAGDRRYVP